MDEEERANRNPVNQLVAGQLDVADEKATQPGKRHLEDGDECDDSEASYASSPVKKRKVAD
jgi:hypothetical protein